jgi:hypothetical protein
LTANTVNLCISFTLKATGNESLARGQMIDLIKSISFGRTSSTKAGQWARDRLGQRAKDPIKSRKGRVESRTEGIVSQWRAQDPNMASTREGQTRVRHSRVKRAFEKKLERDDSGRTFDFSDGLGQRQFEEVVSLAFRVCVISTLKRAARLAGKAMGGERQHGKTKGQRQPRQLRGAIPVRVGAPTLLRPG